MSKHPDTYQYAGGRSIYRNGQPFVFVSRSEEGAYVNPSEADAFARFCAAAPELLREAAEIIPTTPRAAKLVKDVRAALTALDAGRA